MLPKKIYLAERRSLLLLLCWMMLLYSKIVCAQEAKNPRLFVYAFLQTECPISQQSVSALNEIVTLYPQVRVVAVFTAWDEKKQIKDFKKRYNLKASVIHDKKHKLIKFFRAVTTPEVVMTFGKTVLYEGGIDNSYSSLGNQRQQEVQHHLKDAIQSYFSGLVITPSKTTAIGCKIEPIHDR